MSQSKESVWSASRFGTSSFSSILPNEVRLGACLLLLELVLPVREAAKIRPSEDLSVTTAGACQGHDMSGIDEDSRRRATNAHVRAEHEMFERR